MASFTSCRSAGASRVSRIFNLFITWPTSIARKHARAATAVFSIILFLVMIFVVPVWVGPYIKGHSWRFWLQVFAGNWSPDTLPIDAKYYDYQAALAPIVAVIINNGIIFFIIITLWAVITQRNRTMRLTHAFALREEAIKQAILNLIAEEGEVDQKTIDKLQAGFKKGENDWKDYLIELYGKKEAEQVIAFIQESNVPKIEQRP